MFLVLNRLLHLEHGHHAVVLVLDLNSDPLLDLLPLPYVQLHHRLHVPYLHQKLIAPLVNELRESLAVYAVLLLQLVHAHIHLVDPEVYRLNSEGGEVNVNKGT